ncbi:hypothetical protein ARMGADRAFT_1037665 [Armillaria gallica]|uniref:Uncharacterized protein n=1 Tax=Armillaria gallica TaxID=47427 RepID=A0A2H3CQJ2_ARMGA|nr:hypothetical protein ARMGADRAFT_1037665 [Armillaria gallica]
MPYSCPEFLVTQKDLHMWFSSCTTAERSQSDPVLVFGRGIAKALQCFANEIWSNSSEYSHKSIDDMVGSPEEARVLDMLVLFRAMDIACSFLHPTRSRPHHPSYNAMNLSQEELDALEPLHTWCQTLSQILKQRLAIPPLSIPVEGAQLSHTYSRRWVETWEKITCLLDLLGVYIRFIFYHHGVDHIPQWGEDHGTDPRWTQYIQHTGINDEQYLDKLKRDLPHVKKVFAVAVAISPLFIILGDNWRTTLFNRETSPVCRSCSSAIALTQFLDEVQPLLPASPRWGNNFILSDMLQDKAAMVEQEWFLGEWFSDVIQLIQQERALGSEARITARTQVWLDENRSHWREISRHEEVPVERGRRSISPERTKRISIAVLPVLDVNQLTKNYVPDILGGWLSLPLIDQTFLGSGGQDDFHHVSQRKQDRSGKDIMQSGAKKAKMDARVYYFPCGVVLPEVWDPLTNSKVKFTYFALRLNVTNAHTCMLEVLKEIAALILSSHLCAFDKTSDVPGISPDAYPHLVTNFWFVATKGAATNVATDSFGVGTAIEVLCGCQIWYLFQHHDTGDKDVAINWEAEPDDDVTNDWEPGCIPDPKYWTTEIVVLKPGSALYIMMYPF